MYSNSISITIEKQPLDKLNTKFIESKRTT